jgi:hypothetical protein
VQLPDREVKKMSRAGYNEDGGEHWQYALWHGSLMSSIRGKRGQAFLRELVVALETMPVKRLITDELVKDGEVCALGAVGLMRGKAMGHINPEEYEQVAGEFGIAEPLAREIEYKNDECGPYDETPEQRWHRMLRWAKANLKPAAVASDAEKKTI